jgi:hypothetical protein
MKHVILFSLLGAVVCSAQSEARGRHARQPGRWVYCANDQDTCHLPQGEEFSYQVRYVDQGGLLTISMPAMDVPCNRMQFTRNFSDGAAQPNAYCQYYDPRR